MSLEIREIDPKSALLTEVNATILAHTTDAWLATFDAHPAVAWGLVPRSVLAQEAYVWSYAWPKTLRGHYKTFLRRSREIVADMHRVYPILYGVSKRETSWLKHLGAEWGMEVDGMKIFVLRCTDAV